LDTRQKDIELIVRYIALYHEGKEYRRPMKDFLSSFMKRNRNPSEKMIEHERERFKKTCDLILNTLGEKPFNPRGALNASVFDSVFLAFSKHLDSFPKDVKKRYERLKADEDFNKFTRSSTTNEEVVKGRLEKTEQILFKESLLSKLGF
jgi:hypothetical protein